MVQLHNVPLILQIILLVGIVVWGLVNLIIYLFTDSEFTNKDIDFIIESEFKKKARKKDLDLYNKSDEKTKEHILEEFKRKNKNIVENSKKVALQNSVNEVIAKNSVNEVIAKNNVNDVVAKNSVNAVVGNTILTPIPANSYMSSIIEVAEHEFKVVLPNNEIINVRPKVKDIKLWTNKSNGIVSYDYQKTLDNSINSLKDKSAKNIVALKEKIKKALDEYTNSKYMSASITAVATNLYSNV